MKKTTARTALVALTTATLFANSAMAEIKFWDNPSYREFTVNDYAPGAGWTSTAPASRTSPASAGESSWTPYPMRTHATAKTKW